MGRPRNIEFSDDLMAYLHNAADEVDMSTAEFTRAVIAEVRARGMGGRFAMDAVEKGLVPPPNRRPRQRLPWKNDGRGRWVYQNWTLERRGPLARNSSNRKPGDGWFLSGPGYDPPLDLNEMSGVRAKAQAADLLRGR